MRFLRHDLHSLAGPYALDALEAGSERDRFTRHLSRCQSCAAEVKGFREVATAMAFAAAAEAPAELRDRVLTAAARTRQLPPEVSTHAQPRRSRTGVPWVPWLSGVVATASIVVAVLFGFAQAHTRDELNQVKAENQAISLLLSAPEAKLLTHMVTHGGVATVVLAADRHELAVVTTGLPALPSRPGVPALADRQTEDRLGRPAARGQERADSGGAGHRGGQGRHARPDRRARRRVGTAHHHADTGAAPAGVEVRIPARSA